MNKKYLSLTLFIIYVLLRFVFPNTLNIISHGDLFFDLLISLVSIYLYWEGLSFINLVVNKKLMTIYFLAGGAIYCLGMFLQFTVPFQFESFRAFLLMVLIGPIVEECLFRFGLWKLIENFPWRFKYDSLIITTLLFSFSHFFAFFFVTPDFHNFIFYQTAYTLVLGLLIGLEFKRWRSLTTATAHHTLFNLGFFSAYFWKYLI